MEARGGGRILNMASVASFQPVPGMAVYSATKAYVLSLTESLSEEFKDTGVTVTALCPGVTKTELVEDVSFGGQKIPELFMADAAEVAREGYQACMYGEAVRVPGVLNQALVTWTQAQPRWLTRLFSGIAARSTFGT
jgi:short-subunit dehydrogenase